MANPDELTDEHYRYFGILAIQIAEIEWFLRYAVSHVLNSKQTDPGLIMTRKMNAIPLIELLQPLLKYSLADSPDIESYTQKLLLRLKTHIRTRNDLLHSTYDKDENGIFARFKLQLKNGNLDYDTTPPKTISPKYLMNMTREIEKDMAKLAIVTVVLSKPTKKEFSYLRRLMNQNKNQPKIR
jgi:hypothetical protein